MSGPLLVVPPMVKTLAGPLAGPTYLAGVARDEGQPARVVDLNAAWLRLGSPAVLPDPGGPSGDHAQPLGGLRVPARMWWGVSARALGPVALGANDPERVAALLAVDHDAVETAAVRLARGPLGRWWKGLLAGPRPTFVGVSVLWSGQVLGGLVASHLARETWPGVPVVWGGAHVTALAPEIAADARYGRHVDGFVSGYAEGTFRAMLRGDPTRALGVFLAGAGRPARAVEGPEVVPEFTDLHRYGVPRLTLPVQTARGCAYGRCAFGTYPAIEGAFRRLPEEPLRAVVERAVQERAEVAVRDALATHDRIDLVGDAIGGRVRWAATTRLVPRPGRERLSGWVKAGLRTLELGVEALDAETLRAIDKRQSVGLVEEWLADAADLDLHLVLNVIFGFPGQTHDHALAWRHRIDEDLPARFPRTRFGFERNLLEVERRSPMGLDPARFGIEIGARWPWSSVVEWNAPEWRSGFSVQPPSGAEGSASGVRHE